MSKTTEVLGAEFGMVKNADGKGPSRTIDAGTGAVVPLQRTPLNNLENVKRELARVYRRVKAGELPSEEGSKRAYILSTLGKIIEAADLERRIAVLEQGRVLSTNGQELLPAPGVDQRAAAGNGAGNAEESPTE
jgi:hypothetical protein